MYKYNSIKRLFGCEDNIYLYPIYEISIKDVICIWSPSWLVVVSPSPEVVMSVRRKREIKINSLARTQNYDDDFKSISEVIALLSVATLWKSRDNP